MSETNNEDIEVKTMPEESDFSQLLRLLEESEDGETSDDSFELDIEVELDDMEPVKEDNCTGPGPGLGMGPPNAVLLVEDAADDEGFEVKEDLLDDSSFDLNIPEGMLPGALEMVIVQPEDEEEARPRTWSDDGDHGDFLSYLFNRMKGIPHHSGQTTVGCEKAISYLKKLDKEISKAIQSDDDNVIDEGEAETIRDTIHDYIEKLEAAYDGLVTKKRRRKKAGWSMGKKIVARLGSNNVEYYASIQDGSDDELMVKVEVIEPSDKQVQAFVGPDQQGLTKEASYMVTYIDPFIDSITRLLIRSQITHGKDIREVYSQLNEQYDFTDREQLSIHEVLKQKGIGGTGIQVDLGRLNEESPNQFDMKNVEFSTEYYA